MSEDVTVVIVNRPGTPDVVRLLQQGPPGPPGPSSQTIPFVLAATVSGGFGVALNESLQGVPASADTLADSAAFVGVAAQGGNVGGTIGVVCYGPITQDGWNWTADEPVFLGSAGVLTQAAPSSGVLLCVGQALSATTLFVRPGDSILID